MANKNIKEVEGGETATIGDDDGLEIDTGASSLWAKWSTIKSLMAAAAQTLTNKTINLTSNTLTGTKAQFNTALSDDDFATLTGSETLTNKTLTSPIITGAIWDGWQFGTGTWSYSSADDPTFVISINEDVTAKIGVGDRIKLTQTTAKYFIVTAVGAFGGGATLVTVYGGTDYDLANAAITSPYYSHDKAPFGFPVSPAKWTVSVTDTGNCQKATPTANTWYGDTGLSATGPSISIPIGVWYPNMKGLLEIVSPATAGGYGVLGSLSTSASSESDATRSMQFINGQPASALTHRQMYYMPAPLKTITLAAKTTYYFIIRTNQASVTSIGLRGDIVTTGIDMVCAYL